MNIAFAIVFGWLSFCFAYFEVSYITAFVFGSSAVFFAQFEYSNRIMESARSYLFLFVRTK